MFDASYLHSSTSGTWEVGAKRLEFLRCGRLEPGHGIQQSVITSWVRSKQAGVLPSGVFSPPYDPLFDRRPNLTRLCQPHIDRMMSSMMWAPCGTTLADRSGRVIERWETNPSVATFLDKISLRPGYSYGEKFVGTNGIGTVLATGRPVQVIGSEHFHESLHSLSSFGIPIANPYSDNALGVLTISCPVEFSNRLIHSIATLTVKMIIAELDTKTNNFGILTEGNEQASATLPKQSRKLSKNIKQQSASGWRELDQAERDVIERALSSSRGNRVQAAAHLGIARSSLYRKMRIYGLV